MPDAVLLKPARLDAEEWAVMKTHAAAGADLLQRAIDRLGADAGPLLHYGRQIARHHHERWDGSGYPDGLAGTAIPLPARLMAIADVFDALLSRRVYKEAMPIDEVQRIMSAESGRHFDPLLLACFIEHFDEFCALARRFPDEAGKRP